MQIEAFLANLGDRIQNFRRRVPLQVRLVVGYAALLFFILGLGLMAAYQSRTLLSAYANLERQTEAVLAAENLTTSSLNLIVTLDEAILLRDGARFSALVPPALQTFDENYLLVTEFFEKTTALDFAVARLRGFIQPMVIQAENGAWDVIETNRVTRMGESVATITQQAGGLVERARIEQEAARASVITVRNRFIRQVFIAFVLAALLSSLLLYSNVTAVTRRIASLESSASRLAAGDLAARADIETKDEFAHLANTFNHMASEIEKLYTDQEKRIAESTRELRQLTDRLNSSAEVAAAATTLLDFGSLQAEVVDLIAQRFNFDRVGIFMLDENHRFAVLKAAAPAEEGSTSAAPHTFEIGQGVVGQAIETGRALTAEDILRRGLSRPGEHTPLHERPAAESEAALPMRARGQIIGALNVHSQENGTFTPDFLAVLQTLADQIALAFDNARLYQEAQDRLQELHRLYGQYNQAAWREHVLARVSTTYRFTPVDGVQQVPLKTLDTGGGTYTAPIRIRDQEIGRLHIRKPEGKRELSPAEETVLATLIEQVGIALESARLFEDTQRQAQRDRLIGQVTARVRETLDLDTVLQTALREIGRTLDLAEVEVRLGQAGSENTPASHSPAG